MGFKIPVQINLDPTVTYSVLLLTKTVQIDFMIWNKPKIESNINIRWKTVTYKTSQILPIKKVFKT